VLSLAPRQRLPLVEQKAFRRGAEIGTRWRVRSPEKTSESASHSHQFATNGQELKSDEAEQLRENAE